MRLSLSPRPAVERDPDALLQAHSMRELGRECDDDEMIKAFMPTAASCRRSVGRLPRRGLARRIVATIETGVVLPDMIAWR
jgi:hypothetical protein